MLTIFHGNNEVVVRGKARAGALSLLTEGGDLFVMESNSFNKGTLEESLFAQSLMGLGTTEQIIFCDHIFENADARDFFEKCCEDVVVSLNQCVLAEKTLSIALLAKLKKAGAKIIDVKTERKDERAFNTFALGDALGMKDKKNLWILFAQARELGLEGEEICGVLFWQIKNILLAGNTKAFTEAGMPEYPYKKAKGFAKVWKEDELQNATLELAKMYHDAHRGKGNLMNQLELFVLRIK